MSPIALTPPVREDEVLAPTVKAAITDVLDLPQLYSKPSYTTLLKVLNSIALPPPSWDEPPTPPPEIRGLERYLTNIISSPLQWISDESQQENLREEASRRLAERCGRSGMGGFTRDFNVPTSEYRCEDVKISLHEPAITGDALGLKTWGSSYTLAKRLYELKDGGVLEKREGDAALELGSGTGLLGMAFSAVFECPTTLTDLPSIVDNLRRNVETNRDTVERKCGSLTARVLDWTDLPSEGTSEHPGRFAFILAADPIYSPEHPQLVLGAVEHFLCKERGRFIVEMPIRRGYEQEREDFKALAKNKGLVVCEEGMGEQRDDWGEDGGSVRGWWSIWRWS